MKLILLLALFITGPLLAQPDERNLDRQLLANNLGNLSIFFFESAEVLWAYTLPENLNALITLLEKALEVTNNNLANSERAEERFLLRVYALDDFLVSLDPAQRRIFRNGSFITTSNVSRIDELGNRLYLSQLIFRLRNNLALNPLSDGEALLRRGADSLQNLLNN
ncbi:MAG: hypothetical protein FWE37_09070 [Spirochaetaceae bacterium]|nr:hypothetical protein [Spirochaetaceae bacterium]